MPAPATPSPGSSGRCDGVPADANAAERFGSAATGATIFVVWAVAAARWWLADAVVPWDSKNQFYAFFRFLAAAIHDGALPFWNPYHYGGHPSIADPQSLIFAPVFVLWALFDPAPSMRMFDLVVYAHLLAGGLSLATIGRRWRWPPAACVLAAVIFMFGGSAAGRLQHTGAILSYALFPPALLLLQVALQRRSPAAASAFALVTAAMALGRNQVALLLCFLLAACALFELLGPDRSWRHVRERIPVTTVMVLATAALVAVPMLLTAQFAALSNRAEVPLDIALKGSMHPANFALLAVADVFGSHADYWGPGGAGTPEVAYTDDSFNYVFVGSVATMVVLWLGVAGGSAWRRGRRLFAVALGLAALFMLGRFTPLFAWAYDWVPGVHLFRRPVDAGFVVVVAIAVLAGAGLADYMRDGLPRLSVLRAALIGAGAAAALIAALRFSARSDHAGAAALEILRTVPVPLVAGLVLGRARAGKGRASAAAIAVAIAVAELLWWNVAFRLNAEPRAAYAVLEQPAGEEARAIAVLEAALAEGRARGERPRVEVVGLGGPWQNLAMVRGWESTNGYNPLRIGAYDRLVAPGESNWRAGLRAFPPSFPGYDSSLACALGLQFLVLGEPIERMLADPPAADMLLAGPKVWIYRLAGTLPPAVFAPAVGTGEPDARSPRASVRIASWRIDRVGVDVASTQEGVLTLHANYYPGWFATVDGVPRPVRPEGLFGAVEVPAGRHRVVFRYAPLAPANLSAALRTLTAGAP